MALVGGSVSDMATIGSSAYTGSKHYNCKHNLAASVNEESIIVCKDTDSEQ